MPRLDIEIDDTTADTLRLLAVRAGSGVGAVLCRAVPLYQLLNEETVTGTSRARLRDRRGRYTYLTLTP